MLLLLRGRHAVVVIADCPYAGEKQEQAGAPAVGSGAGTGGMEKRERAVPLVTGSRADYDSPPVRWRPGDLRVRT